MSQEYVDRQSGVDYGEEESGWTGMVVFGGVMMMIAGAFTAIAGLVGVFNYRWYQPAATAFGSAGTVGWGWWWLVLGTGVFIAGLGVLAGNPFARAVGVVLALLNAAGQLIFIPAYPIWSLIILTLDILVIYALVVHGRALAR